MCKSTPTVPRVCEYCGGSFFTWPGLVAQGRGRYCSKPCARRHHADVNRAGRPAIPHPTDPTAALIPLTRGKFAVVDIGDAERVSALKWRAKCNDAGHRVRWYASHRTPVGEEVPLHRFILGLTPDDPLVDHEDGDGLNCRRSNMRRATHGQNMQNAPQRGNSRQPFKGVRHPHHTKGWSARITTNGRVIETKSFATPEEAARAYDDLARQHHGKFACLNFPRAGERGAR